MHKYKLKKD